MDYMTQQTINDLERLREKLRDADADLNEARRQATALAQIDTALHALSRLSGDAAIQAISDELAELFADCLLYSHRPERSVDLSAAIARRTVRDSLAAYTATDDPATDRHWILIDYGGGKERRVWTMQGQRDSDGFLDRMEAK